MNSRQYQSTWLGFCNTQQVREAVAEWVHWCSRDELLTDELNVTAQHPQFREHRHDQALLSLVLKRRGYVALPQEDCFDRALYVIDSWVLLAPVHGLRSTRRRSYLDTLVKQSSPERCRRNMTTPSSAFLLRVEARQIRLLLRGFAATIAWRLRPSARRAHRT
jgi:hypothetical protein